MSERVKFIEYKGKTILLVDYSNLPEEEYLKEMGNTKFFLSEQSKGATLRVLVDTTGTYTTDKIKEAGKEAHALAEEAGIKQVIASVIKEGLKRIIARALVKDIYFAKDIEDAKEWLIKQKI